MSYDEFINRLVEKLKELQKNNRLQRYIRMASDDGYTDITISSTIQDNNIKLSLGPEVSLLTVNDFYHDDPRIIHDDNDRPEVLSDLIDTINRLLARAYYEKIYLRNKKEIDRELYLTDSKKKSLGSPMRGKISRLNNVLKILPGTNVLIVYPNEEAQSLRDSG